MAKRFVTVLILSFILLPTLASSAPWMTKSPAGTMTMTPPAEPLLNPPKVQPLASNEWTNMSPAVSPFPRMDFSMAYDSQSDRVILFGGHYQYLNNAFNDTWAYDLNTNTWTNMTSGSSPGNRTNSAMAYDSESDRVVVFGGFHRQGSTLAYDFDSNTWVNMTPAVEPSGRDASAMAYDSESDRIILFGGFAGVWGDYNDETWAYDFNTNTWTNMAPAVKPNARYGHDMAYDSKSDRVILFGGWVGSFVNSETWAYDFNTNTWTMMNPWTRPSVDTPVMTYDEVHDQVLLYDNRQTWAYDLEVDNWTDMAPAVNPNITYGHDIAYDSSDGVTVLFVGKAPGVRSQTWTYDFPATPVVPRNLGAVAGDANVTLTWSPPGYEGGSPITHYNVYGGTSPAPTTLLGTPAMTNFLHSGLVNGQLYYYRVSAVNGNGEGSPTQDVSATPFTTPDAPAGLNAVPRDTVIALSWNEPAFDGSSPITTYNVYGGTLPNPTTLLQSVATTAYNHTGLTNGQRYYYHVNATNAAGEGPASAEISAAPGTPPSSPLSLTATPHASRVSLAWAPPASNGSLDITRYDILRGARSAGESFLTSVGDVHSYEDVAVTNGQIYYYLVTAVNAAGTGAVSNEASATPATTPSPPRNLTAVPGDSRVLLTWDPPDSDGGSPVTEYRVFAGLAPNATFMIGTTTNLSYIQADLLNGFVYYYQVSAVNALGYGNKSPAVNATPGVLLPPTGLAGAPGDGTVVLSWTASASPGVEGHNVYRATSSGGPYTKVNGALVTDTTFSDAGLTNGQAYYYVVTAANEIDESAHSSEISATPMAASGFPMDLALIATAVIVLMSLMMIVLVAARRRRNRGEAEVARPREEEEK